MTAKTLPAASQAPLWGMSNNPAGAVLGRPDGSRAILDRPEQNGAMPLALAGVPSSVFDGPDFGPPDPMGSYWLAFTCDHSEEDAARCFVRRFGQVPRYIFDGLGGLLLVGPVPGLEGGA